MFSSCKCDEDLCVDILEQDIANLGRGLLNRLLKDRTTGKNIIWATDEYEKHGKRYGAGCEIKPNLIIGKNTTLIQPRVKKSKSEQQSRTRNKAEVFTPSWICNEMNNHCDAEWFGRNNVFNTQNGTDWTPNTDKIVFDNPKKSWQKYVDLRCLEITCGEGPYLASRYDTTTGEYLPVHRRIGILDRKLRIVSENTDAEPDWWKWAVRAFQSTYGYEYQGDSLLLARENLLWTFMDYYDCKFHSPAPIAYLNKIADIISWNLWQMNGLTDYTPCGLTPEMGNQLTLFECEMPPECDTIKPCQIKNWRNKTIHLFKDLKGAAKMKFDFCVGNPPYQETKGGTKNVDIWPYFIQSAIQIAHNVTLIHPGRWVIPKKTMKKTHDMIISSGLKSFRLYPNSDAIFPGLRGVDGGITITNLQCGYNKKIDYFIGNKYAGKYDESQKFFSNDMEKEAYDKIFKTFNESNTIAKRVVGSIGSLGSTEFGYDKKRHINLLTKNPDTLKEPIQIWAAAGFGKSTRYDWYYIERSELNTIPNELLQTRKILLSKVGVAITDIKAVGINGIPQICPKLSTGENVFFVLPEQDKDYDLQLIKSLFMTKTARFLMSITQKDLYVRGFENIPDYTNFISLLKGALFSDEWFYKTFEFSDELQQYIETHVSVKTDKAN